MRNKSICLSERTLMYCVGGQLFDQAPNRQPRKAEIIMQKVRDDFRKDAYNANEYYTLVIEENCLQKFIRKLLMEIPEFVDLNLSQIEADNNVSVDDESRGKYRFTSRYDKETSESWKHDFIDLDAFIRNVINNIYMVIEDEKDCFCCAHEKKSEACKTCRVNEEFSINYECGRQPKGQYTFACKYDCFKSRYICCEECSEKDTCSKKCDGNSKECGSAINRI